MTRLPTAAFLASLPLIAFVLSLEVATTARAGGLEYASGGTVGLARGGANAARADTPMVLQKNPAGLAELRGNQLMINLEYARMNACVTPFGYYGWGSNYGTQSNTKLIDPNTGEQQTLSLQGDGNPPVLSPEASAYYNDPYDKVCLNQQKLPLPQLAFSMRLTERLGFGAGLIFPSVTPQGTWGGKNGVIRGDTGELRPTPTRYMMVSSNNLGVFPTVGLGYRLTDWFRIGAALEWGMFAISNINVTPTTSGNSPSKDMLSRISAEDFFVPAFNVSVHLVPVDAIDVVLGFRYQDDLDASGRMIVTSGTFEPSFQPVNTRLKVSSINQPMPWKLWAGFRYADRIRPRPTGTGVGEGARSPEAEPVHDPLGDERWDVELDAVYEMNSRVKGQDVDFPPGQWIETLGVDGTPGVPVQFPAPDTPPIFIQKQWKDQISLRAGGSYNFVPGLFSVSAGAHYENRGINPAFMQLDFWPLQRVGLHAGFTVRLARAVDLNFAYAHIFQETLTVAAPPHDPTGVAGIDKGVGVQAARGQVLDPVEETPAPNPDGVAALRQNVTRAPKAPMIVNAGKYVSSIDVLSAGVQMHF